MTDELNGRQYALDVRAALPAHVRPPRAHPNQIARPALTERVRTAALTKRLTLICAPSGYGKTTLMSEAFRALGDAGAACLWLSVTEADRDAAWLSRMLTAQLARLFSLEALPGEDFASLAYRATVGMGPQAGPAAAPVVVLVDNWNFIEAPSTNRFFDQLLIETDDLVNFVVSSRGVPEFMFETWRMAGAFTGLGARDLAFTNDEAAQILAPDGGRDLSLSLFGLVEMTEGWPAAVQLLRLALDQTDGAAARGMDLSGPKSDVARYLSKAFFNHLPAPRQAFLRDIALLEEMTAEMIDDVFGRQETQQRFQDLPKNDYFITETVEGSGRYRFHSLFRDFLLSQRQAGADDTARDVYARASAWHLKRGEHEQAIGYALKAGGDDVLAMIEDYGDRRLALDGKVFLFTQWIDTLVERGTDLSDGVKHWWLWSLVFSGRWRDALAVQNRLDDAAHPVIAATLSAFSDDQPTLRRTVDRWLADGAPGSAFNQCVMYCAAAVAELAQGSFDSAQQSMHRARFAIDKTDFSYGRVWVLALTAFTSLLKGKVNEGGLKAREAIRTVEALMGPHAPIARVARLVAASVEWYACDDEGAISDLEKAEQSDDEHGLPLIVVCAASVARALGLNWKERRLENHLRSPAINLIREAYRLEAVTQKDVDLAVLEDAVAVFDARMDAAKSADPHFLAHGWQLRDLNIGIQARLQIRRGNLEQALNLLVPGITDAQRKGRGLADMQLTLLRASALYRMGKQATALRLVIQCAETAVRDGLYRPFLRERRFIEPMFKQLAEAGERTPLGNDPRAWRRFCDLLGLEVRAEARLVQTAEAHDAGFQITEREREMLEFLDGGLSNQEIGVRLGIAVPTVKWHLHNLFSKIEVRNRASAVRLARDLHLI